MPNTWRGILLSEEKRQSVEFIRGIVFEILRWVDQIEQKYLNETFRVKSEDSMNIAKKKQRNQDNARVMMTNTKRENLQSQYKVGQQTQVFKTESISLECTGSGRRFEKDIVRTIQYPAEIWI
jgi:hypothetical protein